MKMDNRQVGKAILFPGHSKSQMQGLTNSVFQWQFEGKDAFGSNTISNNTNNLYRFDP